MIYLHAVVVQYSHLTFNESEAWHCEAVACTYIGYSGTCSPVPGQGCFTVNGQTTFTSDHPTSKLTKTVIRTKDITWTFPRTALIRQETSYTYMHVENQYLDICWNKLLLLDSQIMLQKKAAKKLGSGCKNRTTANGNIFSGVEIEGVLLYLFFISLLLLIKIHIRIIYVSRMMALW